MKTFITTLALGLMAAPVLAEGDVATGESLFGRCKSCHAIADGDNVIVRGGRTGPNLFGIMDAPAGAADFRYSGAITALAEAGVIWDEANFIAWVTDPGQFLEDTLGDGAPRTRMSFKLASGAEDIAAYLASLGAAE